MLASRFAGRMASLRACVYGQNAGATFTLSGGSLNDEQTQVGCSGTGVFTQTGGTHTITTSQCWSPRNPIANSLCLGFGAGSEGTYNLNGGVLLTPGLSQSGGTLDISAARALSGRGLATISGGG